MAISIRVELSTADDPVKDHRLPNRELLYACNGSPHGSDSEHILFGIIAAMAATMPADSVAQFAFDAADMIERSKAYDRLTSERGQAEAEERYGWTKADVDQARREKRRRPAITAGDVAAARAKQAGGDR